MDTFPVGGEIVIPLRVVFTLFTPLDAADTADWTKAQVAILLVLSAGFVTVGAVTVYPVPANPSLTPPPSTTICGVKSVVMILNSSPPPNTKDGFPAVLPENAKLDVVTLLVRLRSVPKRTGFVVVPPTVTFGLPAVTELTKPPPLEPPIFVHVAVVGNGDTLRLATVALKVNPEYATISLITYVTLGFH
jgi:hypothetical protein